MKLFQDTYYKLLVSVVMDINRASSAMKYERRFTNRMVNGVNLADMTLT